MKSIPYCLFLCFVLQFGFGQEAIQKDSTTLLDEVTVLEKSLKKKATGSIPSTSIGAKTFQNYSPVDFSAALNQIPGVYVLSGALNTNRITIRGVGARTPFGTDKLRLYYDEIPITNGTGSSTIEAYDLENLASIEVIKGPKATSFGTNLGGAIILNSKESLRNYTRFSNNFTVGSYNLIKNNTAFEFKDNVLSIGLRYDHLSTNGFRENNNFDRDGVLFNAGYRINAKNSFTLLLNHIDYTAQIPSSIGQTAFDEDPGQAAFTWRASQGFEANKYTLAGLSYSHKFTPGLTNTTSIFYTYLDHYEPRPFNILDEFTNGYGFRTRFLGQFNFLDTMAQYSMGAELYKDEYNWRTFENLFEENNGNGSLQGELLSDNKEFRRQSNWFGTLQIPFGNAFSAQLGLNVNKTNYDFRDRFTLGSGNRNAERDFDAIVLPSITFEYAFNTSSTIYANVSRGFSNPNLEETLTPDGLINPDIEQEKGTNYEVGGNLFLFKNKLLVNVALYRMDIRNLLVAERVGDDQFIGRNAGETKHQGIDLAISYTERITPKITFSPFINYTLSDHSFVDFVDGDTNFSGNPLTGVPRHRITSGIQLQFGSGFYWNTTHQFVDEISLRDENTLYSEAFTVFNTRLGYKMYLFKGIVAGLDFGINNIGNVTYAQSVLINANSFGGREPRYFYPGNDRNFYGSLQLRYEL